jgi:hypothetical protein
MTPFCQIGVEMGESARCVSDTETGKVLYSREMDVNSILSPPCVALLEKNTSESQMCAIRLNLMADLLFDQAGAG